MSRPRVLITGGSMGIGRVVAEELAAHGMELVLVARGESELEVVRSGLAGRGHRAHALDVSDEDAWTAFAASLDRLAGLVTAAGMLEPIGPIGSYTASEFRRTIEVNLIGTLLAVHHCLPALRAGRGAVVAFSGGGATRPMPRYDAYAASKAAVVRLTENLALELAAYGIRVNAVAPGFVATRMHERTLAAGPEAAGPEYFARTERDLAKGGVPPEEAAQLVRLLLDAEAAPFSGKLLSAQWDPWREPSFRARLAAEPDLATLRRIDDVFFSATLGGEETS